MGLQRVLVSDFNAGMTSSRLAGKIDSPLRTHGVEHLEGFVVSPDGGVRRRPGTIYLLQDAGIAVSSEGLTGTQTTPAFIILSRRESNVEVPHLAWIDQANSRWEFVNLQTRIVQTIAFAGLDYGSPLQDSGKFPVTTNLATQRIRAWTPTRSYLIDLAAWSLTEETAQEIGCVFQNRFMASDRETGTLYMSRALNLLDYTPVDGEPTGPIRIEPNYYGVEHPVWMKARGMLYVGTDKAEYEVLSSLPYYSSEGGGVIVQKISEIGADRATYFGSSMVIAKDYRLIRADFNAPAGSYVTQSMAEYIDNAAIVTIATLEFGAHRYLFAVDVQKRLWCMTESPSNKVSAWSLIDTDVWWCYSYEQDLYLMKERSGAFWTEVLPMDNLSYPGDRTATEGLIYQWRDIHGDNGGFLTVTSADVTGDLLPPSDTVEVYKLTADGSEYIGSRSTTASGELSGTHPEIINFVGYTDTDIHLYCYRQGDVPTSTLRTLPLTIPTQTGPGLAQPSSITRVVIQVWESTKLKCRLNDGPWVTWEKAVPYSGPVELRPECGYAEEVRVEVQGVGDAPLNIYQIQADVYVGDM